MRPAIRQCAAVMTMVLAAAAAAGGDLAISSASPQGQLTGEEPARVQILFDRAVVPLAAAAPGPAPAWLVVEPALVANWRWAGTATLIGEPLAPLPRATTFRVTVLPTFGAVDGSQLSAAFSFAFTTPRPAAVIEGGEEIWRGEGPQRLLHGDDPIEVRFDQPVEAGALLARLTVRASERRPDAPAAGGAVGEPAWRLEADVERPSQVYRIRPLGCWPRGATVEIVVRAGLRGLEGPEASESDVSARLDTPLPLAPLRFAGRAAADGAIDPEDATLEFSAPTSWRDVADALTVREPGGQPRTVRPQPESWFWGWERESLVLRPLQLEGGRTYEVCVGAEARDAEGGEQGFPWCGTLRTARRAPRFYLVEADGVLELDGPHVLPLRVQNVARYRLLHSRVGEEELVGALQRREGEPAGTVTGGEERTLTVPQDRTVLVPVDLDAALGGRPGIVLSEFAVVDTVPGTAVDQDEADWLRRPRTTLSQVTALGLTVKGSQTEGLLVWVTRLGDATPVAGAEVVVRDQSGAVRWRGVSDQAGLARTGPEVSLPQAFVVTARVGDDLAYARTRWWEGHRGFEFNLPVDWAEERPVLGRVWADRGVVRPGETLHLKAVMRTRADRQLLPPADMAVTFTVRDSRGEETAIPDVVIDAWGAAETTFAVPASAPLGPWQVSAGGVEGEFRVAEFRRPKFRVRVERGAERLIAGDSLAAQLTGELLAGGPMAGAPARWTVRDTRGTWRPADPRWAGFDVLPVDLDERWEGERARTVAAGSGSLDAGGRVGVAVARVEAPDGFPVRLEVEGEVTDVDRQTGAARTTVEVLPGEFFLGVRRPGFFLEAARGIDSAVVALDHAGRPVVDVAVTVDLVRLHWESVRRREVSGRYLFESRRVETVVASQAVTSGADAVPIRFEGTDGGEYLLRAAARDRRGNPIAAGTTFYVFGAGFTPWRMDRENRIDLVAERERYRPGETARVLVKSPWEQATALVTVERAGVLETRVVELTGTMPVFELPVREEHTPNVFVSVVLLRGRVAAPADAELIDPGRPAYRVGYCELAVPPLGRRLDVAVTLPRREARPGEQASATVRVRGADGTPRRAAVTVWAVDAGVLELTGYTTPDLIDTFYARRGLGVSTAESRTRLVGRRSYGTKGDRAGGGGGLEAVGAEIRRDFRALAFWRGDLVTDANGEGAVTFALPDSLTTYRLMAVALAGAEEFGAADTELLVTKPLGLEPALPRFLRPDDRARAGVVVRNRTGQAREVEVRLDLPADGPVRLRGGTSRTVTVPAGGADEVGFGLIGARPGEATLRFTAVAGAERDAIEVTLPVRATGRLERTATFFSVAGTGREGIEVAADVESGSGGLEVSVASSVLAEAVPGVEFLIVYPHECAEQVASRLLGVTAARRLGPGFVAGSPDGRSPEQVIDEGVTRLVACQRGDGGFGFWPGPGPSDPALSAHVAWALAAARDGGTAMPARVLDGAAAYLASALRRERWGWGELDGWTAKVLAAHALVRLGRAEPAYSQWLVDRADASRPIWGRALLAATLLAIDPTDGRAEPLLRDLHNRVAGEARTARLEEPAPEWGWWVWWSEPRGSATALLALLGAPEDRELAGRLARGLLDHLARDRNRTTHDTAWMLQALAAWRDVAEAGAGPRQATVTLAGEALLEATFPDAAPRVEQASVPMAELQERAGRAADRRLPLEVVVRGDGEVHVGAVLAVTPQAPSRPAASQGLAVERAFLDAAGRPVSAVAAGAEVTVEVTVACPATRRFVAVEVPLPAGLEALDTALATTARRPDSDDEQSFWWQPGFDRVEPRDDRLLLYATELPAGRHTTKLACRATTPGRFVVAPARAEEMYAPEVFGTTGVGAFEVRPGGR